MKIRLWRLLTSVIRLFNTLQYYYSKDNENPLSANEGMFMLIVFAIFSLLPVLIFWV
jgi:hypothetical protein